MSVCLPVYLCVCLPVYLSVYLPPLGQWVTSTIDTLKSSIRIRRRRICILWSYWCHLIFTSSTMNGQDISCWLDCFQTDKEAQCVSEDKARTLDLTWLGLHADTWLSVLFHVISFIFAHRLELWGDSSKRSGLSIIDAMWLLQRIHPLTAAKEWPSRDSLVSHRKLIQILFRW